uniref:Uncharacterized protein n=1 Tax=Arundo donax TaxID=35708 RepID=A0A0A9BFS9_ARUDO
MVISSSIDRQKMCFLASL